MRYENSHQTYYMKHGIFHRDDGPAVEWHNGDVEYFINGKLHREDGPAVIINGGKPITVGYVGYYIHDMLHREDGPALIHINGDERYFLHGTEFTKEAFYMKKYIENIVETT